MQSKVFRVCRKELASYFASPVAFIFLGSFLVINLFIFFWVEKFFARNIVDIRPLFEWMPILLIFLVSALTMRLWSEERRSGTVEFLLTLPVSTLELVLGKLFACMALILIALALTLPLPITVSLLGDLDWGPVFGAYIATIFLAGGYAAIGLYVSSRSDNQIVSLIGSVLLSFVLYLFGTQAFTGLLGNSGAEVAKLIGTGSRFESITRGVIDFRDIYYYLSIIGVFVSLNILGLEKVRWSSQSSPRHRRWRLLTGLFAFNFLLANFWLYHVKVVRADLTQGNLYSISSATTSYLDQLQEPLLIRGYFSSTTHPLLAPLVPQLRDLIQEYAVASPRVRAEFIDPRENPDLEEEANRKYGIKPVPFQISDKYQSSLVNSYFDILIQYGDKYEVINFQDLIEVQAQSETNLDVQLRNPEYDITRAIKKVLYGFQTTDHLFASLSEPLTFEGYISRSDILPAALANFREELDSFLAEAQEQSGGKLTVKIQDPQAGDGSLVQKVADDYGFRPMAMSILDTSRFHFYMVLRNSQTYQEVPLPQDLTKEALQRSFDAALKRFSSGFLKTIGLSIPPAPMMNPMMMQMGMPQQGGKQFRMLQEKLSQDHSVKPTDLKTGIVPEDVDLLLVAAPKDLDAKQVFAIDQFLMKGGTVVLAASHFGVSRTRTDLNAEEYRSGLNEWLAGHGISFEKSMVLDTQNESYPVPVRKNIGAFAVEQIQMYPYPYFVDVRHDGMNKDIAMTSGLPQVTLNWPSPLSIDSEKNANRKVIELLHSSEDSWASDSTSIIPRPELYGAQGFAISSEQRSHLLAAVIEGEFTSQFKGKDSPLLEAKQPNEPAQAEEKPPTKEEEKAPVISGVIEKSPASARLIVFASNEFLTDQVLQISAAIGSSRFLNSLQVVENAVDWSLEDRGLLSIRSRGHFSRTLEPLSNKEQVFWEYVNYILALLGLIVVYVFYRMSRSRAEAHYQQLLPAGV